MMYTCSPTSARIRGYICRIGHLSGNNQNSYEAAAWQRRWQQTRFMSRTKQHKYYNTLEVDQNSTAKEIKESFLRLSKVYHPDNKVTGSHNKFVELKEAYDAIKSGKPLSSPSASSNYSSYSTTYRPPTNHKNTTNSAYSQQYSSFDSESRRRAYEYARNPWGDGQHSRRSSFRSPLAQLTIVGSVFAWFIIFSSLTALFTESFNTKRARVEQDRAREAYYNLLEIRRRQAGESWTYAEFEQREKRRLKKEMEEKALAQEAALTTSTDDSRL